MKVFPFQRLAFCLFHLILLSVRSKRLPFPPLSTSTKVLGKTLFLDEDAEKYFYVPQGAAPRKNEKARRMARQYCVSGKYLSKAWSLEFSAYMKTGFPVLMMDYLRFPPTGPELNPFGGGSSLPRFFRGLVRCVSGGEVSVRRDQRRRRSAPGPGPRDRVDAPPGLFGLPEHLICVCLIFGNE